MLSANTNTVIVQVIDQFLAEFKHRESFTGWEVKNLCLDIRLLAAKEEHGDIQNQVDALAGADLGSS